MMRTIVGTLLSLFAIVVTISDAEAERHELLSEIRALDQQIFDSAFLTCDENKLRELMSDDLEFYHDLYGLIAEALNSFLAGTIPDCLARQAGHLPYLERRLEPETMEVRRLGDWGAMQTGRHTFHGRDEDGEDVLVERAEFMHVWQHSEQGWRITRVISYDHRSE